MSAAGLLTAAPARTPVILISVDTLRADHLSSYGSKGRPTPSIDRLARGGTLFANANTLVPLTLPSHVAMLSSRYPFQSGVRDNGQVVPANLLLLPEVLQSQGYRTGAFVGGFVLDRRFGMDQGFHHYDSPFDADAEDLKRLGGDVTAAALAWIDKNSSGPFFAFLHLFDLHTPENLPPAVRKRFPGPRYSAELGYVDEVLGQFFDALVKRGLYDKALIVFVSDHGEGLGDHGENSHGFFVYQSTMAVPLIVHWPLSARAGHPARVEEPTSLLAVAPTILDALGIPKPDAFSAGEVYGESLYGNHHFRTSGLWTLRKGRYKYIRAPQPELYDLQTDPKETRNLWITQQSLSAPLKKRLDEMGARTQTAAAKPSPETMARLKSLGYVGGAAMPSGNGPDPKDRIADYEAYRRAITMRSSGDFAGSNQLLAKVLAGDPALTEVRLLQAMNHQKLNQHAPAIEAFGKVLAADPVNVAAHYHLANSYLALKRADEALREFDASLAAASDQPAAWKHIAIPAAETAGRLRMERKEYDKAAAEYKRLLGLEAGNYEANYNLAWLAARENRLADGVEYLKKTVAARPKDAAARNALGGLYLRLGNLPEAEAELSEAGKLDPKSPWAAYNLGLVRERRGDRAGAAAQFRRALQVDPSFAAARAKLGDAK
jgi:tetratricopeptide (TPR) repeat protein